MLAVGNFEYTSVFGQSVSHTMTSQGMTAVTHSTTRGRSSAPPLYLLRSLENSGAFRAVAPIDYPGLAYDAILEGTVGVQIDEPWWTDAQILVLYLPAWILPTLQRSWKITGEFVLYDRDHVAQQTFTFNAEEKYLGLIWWMIRHGGARDAGFDVALQELAIQRAVAEVFGTNPR